MHRSFHLTLACTSGIVFIDTAAVKIVPFKKLTELNYYFFIQYAMQWIVEIRVIDT